MTPEEERNSVKYNTKTGVYTDNQDKPLQGDELKRAMAPLDKDATTPAGDVRYNVKTRTYTDNQGRPLTGDDLQRAMQPAEGAPEKQAPAPTITPPTKPPSSLIDPKTVSAKEWNKSASNTERQYFRVGYETTLGNGGNLPSGRMADVSPYGTRVHPWSLTPFFNEELVLNPAQQLALGRSKGAWCARVEPGFLNGHPPAIYMPTEITRNQEVWGNDYGKNPDKTNPKATGLTQVLLTDSPAPYLRFLEINDGAAVWGDEDQVQHPGDNPFYFRPRGSMKNEQLSGLDFLNNVLIQADPEAAERYLLRIFNEEAPLYQVRIDVQDTLPEGYRRCYRADVVMQIDRPYVIPLFIHDDIGLLRMAGFTISIPVAGQYSARLFTRGRWTPHKKPTYWDFFYGTYQDYPYDEIVIATIFFLSPKLEYIGEHLTPDAYWVPFVQHKVFWNLNYSSIEQIDNFKTDLSLEFFKQILGVLAGGVAYLYAVSIVNPIEASYDQINTMYNQTAVKGTWWTG